MTLAYRTTSRPSGEAAELPDAGPGVNRDLGVPRLRLGGGAARGLPRIHQAVKGADILAVAPPALEMLPPAAHDDDHGPSPRVESVTDTPVSWGVGYRPGMIGRWPNCGKLMKATEKSGFFRALPWLAQSGIVRAVFGGRHPARPLWRCRSSVVEHVLGKDGVGSSILLGSTTFPSSDQPRAALRDLAAGPAWRTSHPRRPGAAPSSGPMPHAPPGPQASRSRATRCGGSPELHAAAQGRPRASRG